MSATILPGEAVTRAEPPSLSVGPIGWARTNLFNNWWSTAVTLALGYLIVRWTIGFIDWGLIHAVWTVPERAPGLPNANACLVAKETGACWAVIADKWRFMMFGRYTFAEQWRPGICIGLFIALYVVSAMRRFWRWELAIVWLATLTDRKSVV